MVRKLLADARETGARATFSSPHGVAWQETRIAGHDRFPKRLHSIRAVLAAGALGTSRESAAVL